MTMYTVKKKCFAYPNVTLVSPTFYYSCLLHIPLHLCQNFYPKKPNIRKRSELMTKQHMFRAKFHPRKYNFIQTMSVRPRQNSIIKMWLCLEIIFHSIKISHYHFASEFCRNVTRIFAMIKLLCQMK